MACGDTGNGHGQGAGRNKKLKPANRFKKKPGLTNKELAAIGRKTLRERLNVETFEEVLEEIRNRKIAQPFVRTSRENYHEAIGEALALLYAAQIRPDPIRALKSLLPEAEIESGRTRLLRNLLSASSLATQKRMPKGKQIGNSRVEMRPRSKT